MKCYPLLIVFVLWGCGHSSPSPEPPATHYQEQSENISETSNANLSGPQKESLEEQENSVPDQFKQFDFENRSYGRYRFSWGKTIELELKDGKYEYDLQPERGTFYLGGNSGGVYFTDLTNDKHPEALVILSHLSCGVSCDAGAALIYVYERKSRRLQKIWQWETGSMAYGCGLRSITAKNARITLELFGRCSRPQQEYSGSGKFRVRDTTQLTFQYKGKRFVRTKKRFISDPERDVKNHKTEVLIE